MAGKQAGFRRGKEHATGVTRGGRGNGEEWREIRSRTEYQPMVNGLGCQAGVSPSAKRDPGKVSDKRGVASETHIRAASGRATVQGNWGQGDTESEDS